MDTVLDIPWTTDSFLAWEDRQEGKHEFDGRDIDPMTGGSVAHQDIVLNICLVLRGLLANRPFRALQEMRLRTGTRIRYPDVAISTGPLEPSTRTLTDAIALFEVLSEETATKDRIDKLIDYAEVPSLRAYVLLEQTEIAATLFRRDPEAGWIATPHRDGSLTLPGLDISIPLAALYQGLTFPK